MPSQGLRFATGLALLTLGSVLVVPTAQGALMLEVQQAGLTDVMFVDQNPQFGGAFPPPVLPPVLADPDGDGDLDLVYQETDSALGQLLLAPGSPVGGLTVTGSFHTSHVLLPNGLTSGSATVRNDSGAAITQTITVGDTDFLGGPYGVLMASTASGTIYNGSISFSTWDDPSNKLFGNQDPNDSEHFSATAVNGLTAVVSDPGGPSAGTSIGDGLSHFVFIPGETRLFSKTIVFTITLNPGGFLTGRGININNTAAVPEPTTLVGAGLAGLALAFRLRRRAA